MKRAMTFVLALVMAVSLCNYASAANRMEQEKGTLSSDKLSEEVLQFLETAEESETLGVYVVLKDVDEDRVMKEYKLRYPKEFQAYIKACESDNDNLTAAIIGEDNVKDNLGDANYNSEEAELLQRAIELKRSVFREFYEKNNRNILEQYVKTEDYIFCSSYAPMAILNLNRMQIIKLVTDESIVGIEKYYNRKAESFSSIACETSKITYLRDTCGNRGNTVKIGMIDYANRIPDTSKADLSSATIYNNTAVGTVHSHATKVAQILVGNSSGVAPAASLYCTGFYDESDYYDGVEYLLNQGVNIINCSAGFYCLGIYDMVSKWTDHIARQHDVHFVAATGNNHPEWNMGCYVCSPAMGFNVISVGSFDDMNTITDIDDEIPAGACFTEAIGSTPHAEKPNLIASGENIALAGWSGTASGSSLAAPLVTGTIADLCSYNYALKVKQSAMIAIIEACCVYKIYGASGTGVRGDVFEVGTRITPQVSYSEGAGKLDAKAARYMVTTQQWKGITLGTVDIPYTYSVYIDTASNAMNRVALFWLMRNSLSGTHNTASPSLGDLPNMDLTVKDPNGTVLGTSNATTGNYEIVQFIPTVTGYYSFTVTRVSGSSSLENIGLAVY